MKQLMIGMNRMQELGLDQKDGCARLKQMGFEATFTPMSEQSRLYSWANEAAAAGIFYSSIHSPYARVHFLWEDSLDGEESEREQMRCIDACAAVNVPIAVVHPNIGFDRHEPTAIGLCRYRRMADYAESKNVKLAIENVEGDEYLDALMQDLQGHPAVGFCLDSGHELCYNRGRDLLADYGDRLIYTHINSNLGITDPCGKISGLDDAHLLPFDGKVDMPYLAQRLASCNYNGVLMMELKRGRANYVGNGLYASLSIEEYLAEAAARIKRFRDLL